MTSKHLFLCLSLIVFSCSKEEPLEKDFVYNKSLAATEQENQLFDLVNEHRLSQNLGSLTFDGLSYSHASEHSEYMISKGVVSHAKFDERAAEISAGTGAEFVAENVANDYITIEEAMEAWLESPGHKQNIEGDYTHSAISVKEDSKGNLYFTQIFYR